MNRVKSFRAAVGLSGGVDSAVSAYLLKKAGYEVVGVHLYCWPPKSEYRSQKSEFSEEENEKLRSDWIKKNGCRADEDKAAALKTALELEIPFKTLDFSEEYNVRVVDYFYREYEAGRTPNPDVLCNSEIKFGLFLDWALENGFDYVATGHYASCQQSANSYQLIIPKDKHKDQTYFLWKLTQKELKHVLFPLGDLEKKEVREIAKKAALPAGRQGLSVADRKDSQGICFIGNVDAREFLARRLKVKKGEVKNTDGEVIGTHDGVWFYTIGQRGRWTLDPKVQRKIVDRRLSIVETPVFYVISKDAEKNELVVGNSSEAVENTFNITEENWLGDLRKIKFARVRHGGKLIPVKIEGKTVFLNESQRGIASGQSAVFYGKDGEVIGGGVIS